MTPDPPPSTTRPSTPHPTKVRTQDSPNDEQTTLCLFPLASVVLLPRVQVPLYIFEPRYRQMIEASLEGDRRIGMIAVPPQASHQMIDDPEVYPTGTVGSIEHYRRRADGTYDIVLHGTARFRIQRELPRPPQQLYRQANVVLLDDSEENADPERIKLLRNEAALRACELLERVAPERIAELRHDSLASADDELYVNALSLSFDFDTSERQALLEAPGVTRRYEGLLALLHFRLAEAEGCGSSDPGSIQ
jgi:Lon protease-like protein